MNITESEWRSALDVVRSAGAVVLMCHVSPDGDALGSSLAAGLALRKAGIEVQASYDDEPFTLPTRLQFLPGQDLLVAPNQLSGRPLAVLTFDTGSIDRLGGLAGPAKAADALIVVDHHTTNTRYGTHHLIDADAAATAVVVLELVDRLGVQLDADIATALYTGLTTDTGSFRFAATTPEVHEIAARLLRTGIAHERIAREVFDTRSLGYLRLLAAALERAELEAAAVGGLGLVWTVVPAADRQHFAVAFDEAEAVIGTLRITEEAEVAAVCKETDSGAYAVSLRSKGTIDVARLAVALGGGGHRYAAGFTSTADLATTMQRLRAEFEAAAT
ncbi:MAG: DHH family phosphoesterase [Actinomycetes bacterium]